MQLHNPVSDVSLLPSDVDIADAGRRRSKRVKVDEAAFLVSGIAGQRFSCTISDKSNGGVKVVINNAQLWKQRPDLRLVVDNVNYAVEPRWSGLDEIGLAFKESLVTRTPDEILTEGKYRHTERRSKTRMDVLNPARLRGKNTANWHDCIIIDESEEGVQVVLDSTRSLPTELEITIENERVYDAELRWSRGRNAGLILKFPSLNVGLGNREVADCRTSLDRRSLKLSAVVNDANLAMPELEILAFQVPPIDPETAGPSNAALRNKTRQIQLDTYINDFRESLLK